MNPVLVLLGGIVLLSILAAVWLLRPLWRGLAERPPDEAERSNVESARIEWQELKRDRALGLIDEAAAEEAVRELEARVLEESAAHAAPAVNTAPQRYRKTAIAFGLLLPIASVLAYLLTGTPLGAIPEVVRPPNEEAQVKELFRAAEARLAEKPDDLKGWVLLARAKASVGQFEGALEAYAKAVALSPQDADLWADYADAAAGAAQGRMAGKPTELIAKALALDPKHPKALLLRGTAEIQANDLAAAEKTFTQAAKLVEPGTAFASIAENALKDIAQRRAAPQPDPAAASASLQVKLSLAPEALAAAQATPNARIFVIVRAADSERGPPLAVKRLMLEAIKQPITIGAADAMLGGDALVAGRQVLVTARLSLHGEPAARPGDWQSQALALTWPGEKALEVRLDQPVR